jgi:hypothetical protein
MQARPTNEDHEASENFLTPPPARFVRRTASGIGKSPLNKEANNLHANQLRETPPIPSTLKRSQYNRHIGKFIQTEMESCNELPSLEQVNSFEEVWLTISGAEISNEL